MPRADDIPSASLGLAAGLAWFKDAHFRVTLGISARDPDRPRELERVDASPWLPCGASVPRELRVLQKFSWCARLGRLQRLRTVKWATRPPVLAHQLASTYELWLFCISAGPDFQ